MKYFELMNKAACDKGIPYDNEKHEKFMIYMESIKEWNSKINLTAINEDEDIVKKHFIDCMTIFDFKKLSKAKKIIDIGTGAGFPGVPIKILYPEIEVTLLDSLNKRINFLNYVIDKLELKKISTIHARAEELVRNDGSFRQTYDFAVSRAVANLKVLSELCLPYVKRHGYFIAMKGPSADQEIKESKEIIGKLGGKIEDIIETNIEETDFKHKLVIINKIRSTPEIYPRNKNKIYKK